MKTIKQIHTLLAGALLIAGTTLWSGCSNSELLDSTLPEASTAQQPEGISFKLKNTGTQTRATQGAAAAESEVKTMYAAFFIKNEGEQESAYKLHRVYYYDTESGITNAWGDDTKMAFAEANGTKTYTVTTDNIKANSTYTGTYIVYFVANPEAAIKTKLKTYQDTGAEARTTLGTFETDLVAAEAAYDATSTATRGFTMVSKSTIEVAESPKTYEVMLTRLAARFDFVNSSPTQATITSVKFNNLPKQSNLVQSSVTTPDGYFYGSSAAELTKTWTKESNNPTPSMTVYTYENLNTNAAGNSRYSSIDVAYSLGGTEKTLRIDLKEKDTPLAIMRNHLYRINLNCISATYDITVTDWTGGETVTIPNDKLAIVYTADSLGKVGDYVYNNNGTLAFSDGGLRKMYLDGNLEWDANMSNIKAVADKGQCVGIVFSNNPSAKDKAAGFTRGYVMALKRTPKAVWCTVAYDTSLPVLNIEGKVVSDLDGRTNCETLKNEKDGSGKPRVFPALQVAENYAVALPSGCSGWYLPSIGQICCISDNLLGTSFKQFASSTRVLIAGLNNGRVESPTKPNYAVIDAMLSGSSSSTADYDLSKGNTNMITSSEFDTTSYFYLNTNAIVGNWAGKIYDSMTTRLVFAY